MLKIKLLLDKQENILREKIEEKRTHDEKDCSDNKRFLPNELKTTQNTEVPTDDQINDLSKYNFHKNTTNLQSMGFGQQNPFLIQKGNLFVHPKKKGSDKKEIYNNENKPKTNNDTKNKNEKYGNKDLNDINNHTGNF